ncbi:hypothetical protein Manayef4_10515 [Frankia sp. CgMI4]|nr:hypothetical protein Manayef4_10515 [Frankia sp. CgIM4]
MGLLGPFDGVGDEGVLLAVEVGEGFEDGVVDGVGVQSGGVAAVGAVAVAGEAGVVAVFAAMAAGGAGPEHGFAAAGAAHPAGEVVVGGVGGPAGVGFAAGGEQPLGVVEDGPVDDRLVGVDDDDVPERCFAEVDAVVEVAQDLVTGPLVTAAGAVSAVVEGGRDRAGAEPAAGVELEDRPDDRGFGFVGDEGPGGLVDVVAVGGLGAHPAAFAGFTFHPGDDAVDDGVAFELGEHGQHLQEHAAHRGGGVERLRGGPEHDACLVEVFQQLDGVAQVAGEPVDPVDEQDVDESVAGGGQCAVEIFAVGAGAGGVVGEPQRDLPAGLGVDVGAEPVFLGVEGVALVVVVGGAA